MTKHDLKKLHAVLREERLEEEQNIGRRCSKTFGGKPSSKEDRRKAKNKLRKMDLDNYYGDDE
jgi:hypothetical protein